MILIEVMELIKILKQEIADGTDVEFNRKWVDALYDSILRKSKKLENT